MKTLFISMVVLGLFVNCSVHEKESESQLIILKNKHTEVGILPHLGGRIVSLCKPGMDNILKSDPANWNDPNVIPEISENANFKEFNGHIVWVAPQSEWWTQQDLNSRRRDSKAVWPPDPFLIYGKNEILEQTENSITLLGLKSPVSGVQIKKKITLDPNGQVTIQATMQNIRDTSVTWGIWMNTRLCGYARCYVPATEIGLIKLNEEKSNKWVNPMPYEFRDGYFTFRPDQPTNMKVNNVQKAYLEPTAPFIVGFDQSQALKIDFKMIPSSEIHPDHKVAEVYNIVRDNNDLLELEAHGPYTTLAQGEETTMTETWTLYSYEGEHEAQSHIQFIEENMRR